MALAVFLRFAVGNKQLISKVDSARAAGMQELDVGLQELTKVLLTATTTSAVNLAPSDLVDIVAELRAILQSLLPLLSVAIFAEVIMWLVDSPEMPVRPKISIVHRDNKRRPYGTPVGCDNGPVCAEATIVYGEGRTTFRYIACRNRRGPSDSRLSLETRCRARCLDFRLTFDG